MKYIFRRNPVLVLLEFPAMAGLILGIGCSRSFSPSETVNRFILAANSHDVAAELACCAHNIEAEFVGLTPTLRGIEQLRRKAEYDSALNEKMELSRVRADGDSIFYTAVESNDWLKSAGLPDNHFSSIVFVSKKGRIAGLRAQLSDSSSDGLAAMMASFVPWVQEKHASEYAGMTSNGEFIYNAENAIKVVLLTKEWRHDVSEKTAARKSAE